MVSFIDMLAEYARNNVVYVCSDPDEVLKIAKENGIDISVMDYKQIPSIIEFKFPIAIDSYEDFVKYLFPGFEFYDLEVI